MARNGMAHHSQSKWHINGSGEEGVLYPMPGNMEVEDPFKGEIFLLVAP